MSSSRVSIHAAAFCEGFYRWTLLRESRRSRSAPDDCRGDLPFEVHANGKTLVTEPITLVLQSQDGLLEADPSASDNPMASEQSKRVLEVLSRLPGKKSAGFNKLVSQFGGESGR